MRTRKLTLLALAAIAALATSCSNDELNDNNNQKGIVINATAGTPQGGIDTRLTHTDGSTSMDIVWAAGDAFTVYGGSEKHNYTLVGSGGSASASFDNTNDLWVTAPTGSIYALYPTNATSSSPSAITLSLEGQTGALTDLKDYNYMTASTSYTGTGDLTFGVFSHQVAIVKLVLTFPSNVTGTATGIGLKATGLNKSTVLNLTDGTFSNNTAGDVTTGTNTIAIDGSSQLTAYLCVLPGSLTNAKAIATVGSDNYEAELSDLTIAAGNMYTATVTMTKKEAAITWAAGNLVADEANGAKVGTATDGGLFFQFGSLVGWAGGATGDGTGRATDNTTPALAIVIKPANFNGKEGWAETGKIWQGTTGTVPFTATGSDDEKAGIGDPCRYYLKGTWRLPTNNEYVELFKDHGYPSTGPWKWDAASKSATNNMLNLTFPASGSRNYAGGVLNNVDEHGYCWSASATSSTEYGYNLIFHTSGVNSNHGSRSREYGLPVRCVQSK